MPNLPNTERVCFALVAISMIFITSSLFACAGGCTGNCPATSSPSPLITTPAKSEISTQTLKTLVDSDVVTIVEIRIRKASETKKIVGAKILYLTDSREMIVKTLFRKDRLLVLYSRENPDLSNFYASLLPALGYSPVALYREGFDQWFQAGYPVEPVVE